jgi:hypothetical protein
LASVQVNTQLTVTSSLALLAELSFTPTVIVAGV